MFNDSQKNRVARWIAGDISTSNDPGAAIKQWRKKFEIKQKTLAEKLEISPSVISDYESGRRNSPGTGIIKRIVRAFLQTDEEKGGQVTRAFANRFGAHLPPEIILDMQEFEKPVKGEDLISAVDGEILANEDSLNRNLFGYTVIDSLKAVLELTSEDFMGLYGLTTERALVFTKVSTGRSPLVAIKVRGIIPGMIVLHGEVNEADNLGVKIAEILKVPLILSKKPTAEKLLEGLQNSVP
ncbi:XRE family transcriptional regulator [candidate division MSBL1 archaeon SCGC-AAA259E19]|uniref:XRE family transcriptional regulator n=1 Tax=candidate division MSBL1 archaeon SCGC-AAA259E19 TaxID=1698264 RepID=A0A133UNH9_9EURY|nr:XRE family transcriptional regulator [candidate division MSBL1 archaeon SCGC-AAA259E19]